MLLRPILSRICKHQRFANFCILKNVGRSIVSPENGSSPSNLKEKSQEKGYVISFLVNKCGLSPEKAISASKRVHFDSPDKPNAVLSFLDKRGFSKTQIAELVRGHPQVLVCNPKKCLSPKIEFLLQFTEMSEADVLRTFTRYPDLFARRLEHRIIPIDYLKGIIGARKVDTLLKRGSWVFSNNLWNRFIPNVDFLKEVGVPKPCIQLALYNYPEIFSLQNLELREIVEEVKHMGFDPSKSMFVCAIHARRGKGSRATWDRCYEVYSKWGWSKDDILMAFRKHPKCMCLSEKKISTILDFLVNKIGRESRSVARYPQTLLYNMEKRTVPRCTIVHLLSLKGLVKIDWSLSSVLNPAEKYFLEMYVTRYSEKLPQLHDIYLSGKAGLWDLTSVEEGPSLVSPENGSSPSHLKEKEKSQEKGYVISYLVNSCGLSPEKAISTSRKVHFYGPDKPNAVLNFLDKRGFSKTQIAELVRRHPKVLVCNPKKSLSPKIEFLLQFTEMPETDILRMFTGYSDLFTRSLGHRILPVYDYLKDMIGARKVETLLRRGSWVFGNNLKSRLIPNVDLLKELGVPKRCIQLALYNYPEIFSLQNLELREIAEEVKQMGFDPSKSMFVCAINARTRKGMRATWDHCYEVYSKWGWSKDDIHMAFRKNPSCMLLSEKKISSTLDFLVNNLGRESRSVARYPQTLVYNMEKRIVPRCSIVHLLSLKGLVKKDWSFSSVLNPAEKYFLDRYVIRYVEKLPELYDIYLSRKAGLWDLKSVEEG